MEHKAGDTEEREPCQGQSPLEDPSVIRSDTVVESKGSDEPHVSVGSGSTAVAVPALPSYSVGVQACYLVPRGENPFAKFDTARVAQQREGTGEEDIAEDKDKSEAANQKSKKRPRDARASPEDRLCSATNHGKACQYGDKCNYSHDVEAFLAKKEADIGPICYQFRLLGYCPNGLMCRFGSDHIIMKGQKIPVEGSTSSSSSSSLENVESIEVQAASDVGLEDGLAEVSYSLVVPSSTGAKREDINVLDLSARHLLRKKKYDFSRREKSKEKRFGESSEAKGTPHTTSTTSTTEGQEGSLASSSESDPSSHPFSSSVPYPSKVKLVDFSNKVYIAPLTTVGNLPFRRILKDFGADITCGEMAMGSNLLQGQPSEWALLRRHSSEDVFGIQVAGNQEDHMARVAKLLENETESDFVDLNCGCPIDILCNQGCGAALMNRPKRLVEVAAALVKHLPSRYITVKMRTGWDEKTPSAHKLITQLQKVSKSRIAAVMVHGRSRLQRYSKLANWEYILEVAKSQDPTMARIPVIGNGDIMSWTDWSERQKFISNSRAVDEDSELNGLTSCAMVGRGALIKPWLPTEIKESRHWDISANERLDIVKTYVNYGLEHWGSDQQGVNTTRRFLLEWLSYLHRYVPVGIMETELIPQRINQRPPFYFGRGDLETLLSSGRPQDWVAISEMFLGKVSHDFVFVPKHKSQSYE